jgi:parallel beta-helix repeat protein
MKKLKLNLGGIQFLTAILVTVNASATNYYFSSSSGDDNRTSAQAQSSATPWKTISKLNSIFSTLLKGGDIIYFKRGDVFYGSIIPAKSGSAGLPITFDAYGTGNKPIITGFTSIGSWTSIGGGRYQAVLSSGLATLNAVNINGNFQPIGRYPKKTASNQGYLTVNSFVGNTSISSSGLSGLPSFVGGQVVIRKVHWILDKGTVTGQSSSSVSYSGGGYNASNGFGFFFQNHINACTSTGDWCYNPSTKQITIYYGSTAPPAYAVQAATIDILVNINSKSYLTFNNLSFVGSNSKMFYLLTASYIVINACDFTSSGGDGLNATVSSHHITVTNSTAKWTNNDFIFGGAAQYWNIAGNNITNTGSVAGMGNSGDATYTAIYNIGAGSIAQYNYIRNTGYTAIDFRGNSITVQNNFIDTFCRVKDDGGAIYTYTGANPIVYSQRYVNNNIVLNGGGAGPGTTTTNSDAYGIYMDNLSSNVTISGNTVANCGSAGIFLHANHDMSVTNNTLYNNVQTGGYGQMLIRQESFGLVRNLTLTGNKVVSRASNQLVAYYWTNASDFNLWGTLDNNYYCRPLNETNTFQLIKTTGNQNTTLAGWQSAAQKEWSSKKSPKTITNINSLRFEYNLTTSNKTVSLGAAYIDVKGVSYPSSITLAPFTSAVLIPASGGTTEAVATAEVESNLNEKPSFTIYPNPVRDNFVLQLNNSQTGKMNVQVVNQAGAIIRSYLFNKDQILNQVTVPANDLPTGVYFIHVQIGTWSDKKKIVKL